MRGWGGFVSDRLSGNISGIYSVSVDQPVKLGRTILPLHFDVRQVERWSGGDSLEASARASASFRALTFTGQLDWSRTKAPSSEERRVGNECVGTCGSRGAP